MFPGMWSIFDYVTEEQSVELGCGSCWNLPGKAEGQHSSMRPLGVMKTRFVILVPQKSKCDLKTTPCAKCDPKLLTFPTERESWYVASNVRRYMMTMPFSFVSGTKKQHIMHRGYHINWQTGQKKKKILTLMKGKWYKAVVFNMSTWNLP